MFASFICHKTSTEDFADKFAPTNISDGNNDDEEGYWPAVRIGVGRFNAAKAPLICLRRRRAPPGADICLT